MHTGATTTRATQQRLVHCQVKGKCAVLTCADFDEWRSMDARERAAAILAATADDDVDTSCEWAATLVGIDESSVYFCR